MTTGVLLLRTRSSKSSMLWTVNIFCSIAVLLIHWTRFFNGITIGAVNCLVTSENIFLKIIDILLRFLRLNAPQITQKFIEFRRIVEDFPLEILFFLPFFGVEIFLFCV